MRGTTIAQTGGGSTGWDAEIPKSTVAGDEDEDYDGVDELALPDSHDTQGEPVLGPPREEGPPLRNSWCLNEADY